MGTQAYALSYDFNLGAGIGIQTPFMEDEADAKNISWSPIGGFVGAGVSFGESFVSAVGLEYTAAWQMSTLSGDMMGISYGFTYHNLNQFYDVYYKASVMRGALPIDIQLNLGLATKNVLRQTNQMGGASASMDIDYMGLGFHAGLRANVHMFFLGLDYSYVPSFTTEGFNFQASQNGFNANSFGVTVGVIFNKGILDSFLGN